MNGNNSVNTDSDLIANNSDPFTMEADINGYAMGEIDPSSIEPSDDPFLDYDLESVEKEMLPTLGGIDALLMESRPIPGMSNRALRLERRTKVNNNTELKKD